MAERYFDSLVKKTRSFRNFDAEKTITEETLIDIIDLCRFTPSAANLQPIRYAYAAGEDCAKIFPLLSWAGYLKDKPPFDGNVPTAYVLMCYDKNLANCSPECDIGIAAQTLVLAAMDRGIGACMIGSFRKVEIIELFSLPEVIVPRLIIALGVPKETVSAIDSADGNIRYFRTDKYSHVVPKRPLSEILLPKISACTLDEGDSIT